MQAMMFLCCGGAQQSLLVFAVQGTRAEETRAGRLARVAAADVNRKTRAEISFDHRRRGCPVRWRVCVVRDCECQEKRINMV